MDPPLRDYRKMVNDLYLILKSYPVIARYVLEEKRRLYRENMGIEYEITPDKFRSLTRILASLARQKENLKDVHSSTGEPLLNVHKKVCSGH